MKKIIFSTMIASLLAFVGCQNEELVSESTDNSNGKKITLTARIAGSTDSRVVLNDKNENGLPFTDSDGNPFVKVNWEDNDEEFTVYSEDYSSSAVFRQDPDEVNEFTFIGDNLPENLNTAYYGRYNVSDGVLSYDLSAQDGTLDKANILMQAPFDQNSDDITFQHKTAILKVTFKVGSESINTNINNVVLDGAYAGSSKNQIIVSRTKVTEDKKNNIYIFLPIENDNYSGDTFTFTVTAGGQDYKGSLTINGTTIQAGNLYTATINLQQVEYCALPTGANFCSGIKDLLSVSITGIKFVANSQEMGNLESNSISRFPDNLKYKLNGTTLELHTNADFFKFNADCYNMFSTMNIISIDFGNRINTSFVTNMSYMFSGCQSLEELDLSNFNTENVTNFSGMFGNTISLGYLILSDNFVFKSNATTTNMLGRNSGNNETLIDFKNVDANEKTLNMLNSAYPGYNSSYLFFKAIVNQNSYNFYKNNNADQNFLYRLYKRKDDGTITPWEPRES